MTGPARTDPYDTALVLARVLTSGVVMSIERSDRELPALTRLLTSRTGRKLASLVNSGSAGIHAALAGQGIGYGDTVVLPALTERQRAFVSWLGITADDTGPGPAAFGHHVADPDDPAWPAVVPTYPVTVLDLTGLGFGPAAAVLTDDEAVFARMERLKIFGSHDLRTMWTQQESDPDNAPGVQFNYRLSPLVAACIRMTLSRAAAGGNR